MKKTGLLSILILFVNIAFSQTPSWFWAKSNGGINNEESKSICCDTSGNIYIIGNFESPVLVFGNDTLYKNGTIGNSTDIFVVKFDPDGNIIWAKSAGGGGYDQGQAITSDKFGNIYFTGYFASDFIAFNNDTMYITDSISGYTSDVFVFKMNAYGDVQWSKSLGDTISNVSMGITTDNEGNLFLSGGYESEKFFFAGDSIQNVLEQYSDIFLIKLDSTGNEIWLQGAGSRNMDWGKSIVTDTINNIYMTGYFYGDTLLIGNDTLFKTHTSWFNQESDMFIAKYGTDGNLIWAKNSGGNMNTYGLGIAVDLNGNIFVTGGFTSDTLIFNSDTLINSENNYPNSNGTDFFLVKYDSSGNVLWATSAGDTESDNGYGIITDQNGYVYVTGEFSGSYIKFDEDTLVNSSCNACIDVFVVKYNPSGNVVWAINAGGNIDEEGRSITRDEHGHLYVTGMFDGVYATFGGNTLTNVSTSYESDIFIAKLDTILVTEIFNQIINTDFILYPNPAKDIIEIIFPKKSQIEIQNINGQILENLNILDGHATIDISGFAAGVYLVKVKHKNGVTVKRFIKE